MLVKKTLHKRAASLKSIFFVMALGVVVGCATPSTTQQPHEESRPASIQDINVSSLADNITVIEIVNSKTAPFTTFKLLSPPRALLDIQGIPAPELSRSIDVNDSNLKTIVVEKSSVQAMTTRIVAGLADEVDYKASARGNSIVLTLESKKKAKTEAEVEETESKDAGLKEADQKPVQPRVFFKPRSVKKNEVLGVDFTMLSHGRSRLTVTTDRKVSYDVEQKDPKTLILQLRETTIPPLLLRRLDSSYFKGAVDRVKPSFSSDNSILYFTISLRDVVPFHVDQGEAGIQIDFGRTAVKPPVKNIVPVALTETEVISSTAKMAEKPLLNENQKSGKASKQLARKYTGAPMTMDFVNAEVTNILRLIGEISNLNIIWGNEVKGTVSMKLKNVPWDQALELVLTNNDLGMRHEGNIIWVTTKTKIEKIEAEEKKKREEAKAAERKKLEEAKRAKELEPLVTDYLPIDFADAEADIKPHIEGLLTKRGKISIDSRTNTVILTDIASVIQMAKETVKRFDAPVKQIMIEARIVDATDSFSRDLGVEWGSVDPGTSAWRKNFPDSVEIPPSAIVIDGSGGIPVAGGRVWGGSFSTNSPA
ncbi:MAG: AMIN domain-containing protein, partial [Desulfatiglans sp.]|nr:AMIN domain-containing protein [Desulfatiglans sp.]